MLAALVAAAWAQAAPEIAWSPVLEVRERVLSDGDAAFEQRARLGLEVERLAVSARVTFEDVRRWGLVEGPVSLAGPGPTVSEAWIRAEGHLTRNVGAEVTIGRQAVKLHEGRLLGVDPFEATGRRLDAARLIGRAAPFEVEYIAARRFDEGPDPLGRPLHVLRAGARGENPVTAWVADGVWVLDGWDAIATSSTAGGYARFDSGRLRTRFEGYLQADGGRYASLVAGSAGWVFGPNERLVAHARGELLSGDAEGGRWRPVLGDTRTFNGLLDVYADPDTRPDGLADAQIAVDTRPTPSLAFGATAHAFTARGTGAPLGAELDATATWWFSPFANLHAAGGWFVPADGDGDRLFGYVELDATF